MPTPGKEQRGFHGLIYVANTTNRIVAYLVFTLHFVWGRGRKVPPSPPNTTPVTAWAQPQSMEPHNRISSNLTGVFEELNFRPREDPKF